MTCFRVLRAAKQLYTADHLLFYQLAHQRWMFKLVFIYAVAILCVGFAKKS